MSEQPLEEERRDEVRDWLRRLDAEAWQAYAASVARREPRAMRRRAFDVAMRALETFRGFERAHDGEKVVTGGAD